MNKGSIQNRKKFLDNITDRLGGKRRTEVVKPEWEYQPQQHVYKDKTSDELREIFEKSSEEKDTNVIETTKRRLEEAIKMVIDDYGGSPMVATKDERFDDLGLTDLFEKENVYIWDADAGEEKNVQETRKANIGFLVSDISLAESGTITQFNGRSNARSVSLLPITYVAIVPQSTIVPRMTQAMDRIQQQVNSGEQISPYINYITGPSNSADIEMNIVAGVHGPVKAVHVVVTDI